MERKPAYTPTSARQGPLRNSANDAVALLEEEPLVPLHRVLLDVFDPDRDRIVQNHGEDGEGLSSALGFIGARMRLRQDHWVVYVTGRGSLASIVTDLERWSAFKLERFLIIVGAEGISANDEGILQDLRAGGFHVVDVRATDDPLEIRETLRRIRDGNAASVVLAPAGFCLDEHDPAAASVEWRDETACTDPVMSALVSAVRQDPGITPVLMRPDQRWRELTTHLPASLLRVAPHDIEEAIPWCVALAEGGCYPVLIMSGCEVEHRRQLAAALRRDPQPMSLIVDDRESYPEQIHELVGGALPIGGEFVPGVSWVCPASADQAALTLREALADRRSLALRIPPTTTGDAEGAGRSSSRAAGRFYEAGDVDQAAIREKVLSSDVLRWVTEYEQVGHRGRYLWRWCLHGLELTTLSCVPRQNRAHVCDTKLLAVIYGVLLDDIADREHDADFLRWLTSATLEGGARELGELPSDRRAYAEFTCRIWDCYLARIRTYPRYEEFAGILEYDSRRVVNTMLYALLVNRDVRVMNRVEHDLYTPHNMQMMTFAMVDLMASPGFAISELGWLRHAIWHAQCMGRIGNLVSTWERELAERDFSSGVFARLLDAGGLNVGSLPAANDEMIRTAVKSGGIESSFLDEWVQHHRELEAMVPAVGSVNLKEIVTALDRLIRMELFSRGLK